MGASNTNATSLPHLSSQALALKMYLNTTFSTLKLDSMETWMKVRPYPSDVAASSFVFISSTCQSFSLMQHFEHWPKNRLICVHTDEKSTAAVILLAELYKRHVHVCHVARREEVGVVWSYAKIT